MRMAIAILGVTLASGVMAFAAGPYKAGWTTTDLDQAAEGCTGELVQGAWVNTKKDQHVDPDMEMTPEIRKQLEPQIKAIIKYVDQNDTIEGAPALAKLPALEVLVAIDNSFSDAALTHLAQAKRLKELRLQATGVTGAGVKKFAAALSGAKFDVVASW